MVDEKKIFCKIKKDERGNDIILGDIGEGFGEFTFDFSTDKVGERLKLFENVFKMVYKNDYMQYTVVDSILKLETEDLKNKDKKYIEFYKVHFKNFIVPMLKSDYRAIKEKEKKANECDN